MRWYGYLADAIVAIHLVYMAFVVFGELAIVIGAFFRWQWIRNPWFRFVHLFTIAIVALEAIFGLACPLTTWEYDLRLAAGEQVSGETFVGRLMHNVLFHPLPPWVYTVCYTVFALLVAATLIWVPPRRPPWLRWPRKPKAHVPGR